MSESPYLRTEPDEARLRLRPMRDEDIEEITRIEAVSFPDAWRAHFFEYCLRNGYSCWVCERHGTVAAYAVMAQQGVIAHLMNICVRPDARRQGVGRVLIDHLIRLCREGRSKAMMLEVRPSNQAALRLYGSAGFQRVGVREGYYRSLAGNEDALIMALYL